MCGARGARVRAACKALSVIRVTSIPPTQRACTQTGLNVVNKQPVSWACGIPQADRPVPCWHGGPHRVCCHTACHGTERPFLSRSSESEIRLRCRASRRASCTPGGGLHAMYKPLHCPSRHAQACIVLHGMRNEGCTAGHGRHRHIGRAQYRIVH